MRRQPAAVTRPRARFGQRDRVEPAFCDDVGGGFEDTALGLVAALGLRADLAPGSRATPLGHAPCCPDHFRSLPVRRHFLLASSLERCLLISQQVFWEKRDGLNQAIETTSIF